MSIQLHTQAKLNDPIPGALGLAWQIGELQVDFRRRGILLTYAPERGELTVGDHSEEAFSIRYENAFSAIGSILQEDDRTIAGISIQDRRDYILVLPDSKWCKLEDLRGAVIGVPYAQETFDELWRAAAMHDLESALYGAGIARNDVSLKDLGTDTGKAADRGAVTRRVMEALLRGEADAVLVSGISGFALQNWLGARPLEGFHRGADQWEGFLSAAKVQVLTIPAGLSAEQQAAADRVLAHAIAASQWAIGHRAEANRLIAREMGIPETAVEVAYSANLHAQLDLEPTTEKLEALERYKQFLFSRRFLARNAGVKDALDAQRFHAARLLIESGQIELPGMEPVSPYALADVPRSFFTDRPPAHILSGDKEALEAAKSYAAWIKDGESDRDRYRQLPFEQLKQLAASGLLGLMVPKAYGGPGISVFTLTEIFKIISAADGSLGQIPQNHHFFVKTVELVGTEEQKAFFFSEVLKGAQFGNALAERGLKSYNEMSTRLKSDGKGGYRLSGTKYYATGALYSHWIPVSALDESNKRITAMVPRHAEGVTVIDDWSGVGQRTTASGSVILRDVEVPQAHILPHWKIFEPPQIFAAFGQIMHAAIDVGIAQAALADAAWFVREKTRPPLKSGLERASDDPDQIRRFGELGIRLHAAEALLEKAARLIDEVEQELNAESAGRATLAVDSAKYFATEVAIEVTNALFEVAGSASMDQKYNLDRHWRNVRIHTLHDPARLKLHHTGCWFLNGIYHEYKI